MVFADQTTDAGTLGIPAEARGVFAVGAHGANDKVQAYSAEGPPAFADLAPGPQLYERDQLQVVPAGQTAAFGTSLAASYTAGWAASVSSDGFQRERMMWFLQARQGKVGQ